MLSDGSWKDCAERAIHNADDEVMQEHTDLGHPSNLLLFLFLTEAHAALQAMTAPSNNAPGSSSQVTGTSGSSQALVHFTHAVRKAITSLRSIPTRVYDPTTLASVSFIGPVLVRVVVKHLWSIRAPPPASEEDLEIAAAIAAREKKERADERKKAKEKKEAKAKDGLGTGSGNASQSAPDATQGRGGGGGAKKRQAPVPASNPIHDDEDQDEDLRVREEGGPGKKKQRQAKEYRPLVGTANYAFLVTLYISKKSGIDFETKETLMQKAEASGLSNKSLFGSGQTGGGNGMHYDGWSSFNKSLVNRTPPLVQAWSNPKQVRLTAEGLCLAAELYKDAVDRCKVTAIPNLNPDLDIQARSALDEEAKGSGRGEDGGNEKVNVGGQGGGAERVKATKGKGIKRGPGLNPNSKPATQVSKPALGSQSDLASRSLYAAIARSKDISTLLSAPSCQAGSHGTTLDEVGGGRSKSAKKGGRGSRSNVIVIESDEEDKEPRHFLPSPSLPPQQAPAQSRRDVLEVLMDASRQAQRKERERGRGSVDSALTFGDGVASHSGRGSLKVGHGWKIARLGDPRPSLPRLLPPILPGQTFEQQYEIVLVIDHREQIRKEAGKGRVESLEALVQRIRDKGITVISDLSLPIGDVVWCARSRLDVRKIYVLDYIMERKGINDLASSIKDHRYVTQKYWLKLAGLSRLFYLIEGDPDLDTSLNDIERKAVKTAILQTHLNGFHLLTSAGPHPTLLLLANLTKAVERAHRGLTHSSSSEPGVNPCLTLAEWISRMRRIQGSITIKDMFGLMLCSVPGAGEVTVEAILDKYSTWHDLWGEYKRVGERGGVKAQELMLAGIRIEGSMRAVGPELSKKIFSMLFKAKP